MHYNEAKSYFDTHHICAFCQEKHPHMIYENELMFVIPARAPYVADHLLIIPKRHVTFLKELTHQELESLHDLVDIRTNKLHAHHEAVNLLLRDGLAGGNSNKSVDHLHFHLIPDCPVGAEEKSGEDREFFSDHEYTMITQKIKTIYV